MADDAYRTRLVQNIHDLKPGYHDAGRRLVDFSPIEPLVYDIWNTLNLYQPGDDPHKAVYLVARCRTLLEPFARNYSVIEEHEEAMRKLEVYDTRKALENG